MIQILLSSDGFGDTSVFTEANICKLCLKLPDFSESEKLAAVINNFDSNSMNGRQLREISRAMAKVGGSNQIREFVTKSLHGAAVGSGKYYLKGVSDLLRHELEIPIKNIIVGDDNSDERNSEFDLTPEQSKIEKSDGNQNQISNETNTITWKEYQERASFKRLQNNSPKGRKRIEIDYRARIYFKSGSSDTLGNHNSPKLQIKKRITDSDQNTKEYLVDIIPKGVGFAIRKSF